MNKPDWVQKHWYDLRLAHQQPKAGARSRQTVVSVFRVGDGTAETRGERRTVVGGAESRRNEGRPTWKMTTGLAGN